MTRSGNVETGYSSKHFNCCKIAITLKTLKSARHWVVGRQDGSNPGARLREFAVHAENYFYAMFHVFQLTP